MSTSHDPVIESSFTTLFLEKETIQVLAHLLRNVSSNLSLHFFPDYETTNSTILQWNLDEQGSSTAPSERWTFLTKLLQFFFISLFLYVTNRIVIKSRFATTILETVIWWTISLFFSPVILGLLLPSLAARAAVYLYLKIKYDTLITLATPVDSTWGFESYANTSTCPGLYVIKGKCNFEKIQNRFSTVLELKEECSGEFTFLKMRRKLRHIFSFVCWEVDTDFSVKNHVKLLPGDEIKSESDTFEVLSQLQDEPLSLSGRSPWDVHVVSKYTDENHYALIFRIHHSIMDGVSTGNALCYLADDSFEFTIDPLKPFNKKISDAKKVVGILICLTQLPRVLFRNLYAAATESNGFHGMVLTGPKKFVWTKVISMEAVKKIREESKTSAFAVLMSSLAGAMRSLYIKNKFTVPNIIHATPPVAMVPYPDRRPRNKFTLLSYPLAVSLPNPKDRLQEALKAVKQVSNGTEVLTTYYLINMLGLLPICLLKPFGSLPHTTTILSNIPGPKELVKLFEGDTLMDIGAFVPLKNKFGIGAALFSYAGRIRVTFIADKAVIPESSDVEFLRDEFERQIAELSRIYGDQDETSVFI